MEAIRAAIIAILTAITSIFNFNPMQPQVKYQPMGETRDVNIYLNDTYYVTAPVPKSSTLVETDGLTHWVYTVNDERFVIDKTNASKSSTVIADKTSVGVMSKDHAILYSNENGKLEGVAEKLQAPKKEKLISLSNNNMTQLDYEDTSEGVLGELGVYFPSSTQVLCKGFISTAYTYVNDTSFMTAYKRYGRLTDIRPICMAWLGCIDEGCKSADILWYSDESTFYAETDEYCIGARALTTNNWAIICASKDYKRYVMMNLTAPHSTLK